MMGTFWFCMKTTFQVGKETNLHQSNLYHGNAEMAALLSCRYMCWHKNSP